MLCSLCETLVIAANWAQASGEVSQNVVIPYVPSPEKPHWAARFGMTTVAVVCKRYT